MADQQDTRNRLTIRAGSDTLTFSASDPQKSCRMVCEPYEVNMAIAMAANLREAFNTSKMLQENYQKAMVLVNAPTMLVPLDEYEEDDAETLYHSCFSGQEGCTVHTSVIPSLNAVAAFAVNKDLKTVVTDHFNDVRFMPIGQPVWEHLHSRGSSQTVNGYGHELFAYFHDDSMEVFCFQQNRFKFYNVYDAQHAHDALYFLLYAWKQLGFDAENDTLHLVGELRQRSWLMEKLHQYLKHVYAVTTTAEFQLSNEPIPKGGTYDLLALYNR